MNNSNFLMYDFIVNKFDLIQKACFPLHNYLSIDAFAYIKVQKNGDYYGINTDLLWCKDYVQNAKTNRSYIYRPYENNLTISRWPLYSLRSENNKESAIFKAYHQRGFLDGIDVCRQDGTTLEAWTFIVKDDTNGLMDFYLTNSALLKQFISYIDAKLQNILGDEQKIPLATFEKGAQFYNSQKTSDSLNIREFFSFLNEHNTEIHSKNGNIKFTKREFQCMHLLSSGYSSAKEIANILEVSERTIESFFSNIKYKTGFYLKSDIIKFYLDHLNKYDLNINQQNGIYLKNETKVIQA